MDTHKHINTYIYIIIITKLLVGAGYIKLVKAYELTLTTAWLSNDRRHTENQQDVINFKFGKEGEYQTKNNDCELFHLY